MFVQPTQQVQDNYEFLLSVYEKTLEHLKDGVLSGAMKSNGFGLKEEGFVGGGGGG